MEIIGELLILALNIFFWIIIIQVVLSWLIAFDVVNVKNPQAQNLIRLITKITDPVYKPLRNFIPAIGGIDITPIIVILGISILKSIIVQIFIF
jgi:YggT family protein